MGVTCTTQVALDGIKNVLKGIADGNWLGELAQRVSAGAMKLVADEFKSKDDPYGEPWSPLKRQRTRDKRAAKRRLRQGKTPRGSSILIDTGRMRASVGATPNPPWARIVVPTFYAQFHQTGTVHMPARKILPDADSLPDVWRRMVEKESVLLLKQRFKATS